FQLARRGYPVTVFEAFAQPGGMLRYGIPAFRLPPAILDAEIDAITRMGVEIVCNTTIGKDIEWERLRANYDAIFVGIGAHKGVELEGNWDNAPNVLSGVAFLNQVNSGKTIDIGDRVVIIGGGNTAITAARVARRLEAQVTLLYRRTRAEMPTLDKEIDAALIEEIDIRYLVAPLGIRSENGKGVAVKCQRMKLDELDNSGRRMVIPVAKSEFEVPCTAVIYAISQRPDWSGIQLDPVKNGWLMPDEDWSVGAGVYAGGDVISLELVTTAIGHGRMAAERIDAKFKGKGFRFFADRQIATPDTLRLEYYPELKRNECNWLPVGQRCSSGLESEAELGITEEQFQAESIRCMSCGLCFECRQCLIFCPQSAILAFP
ncbi:MAG: FAD-dependent oxidoreductase, partial [Desulfobulbaceae bacterium]|nr:FAD-dependent oxidoreductase [Desulfobulbaceae bacterium]